jgi:hypothetical protein
MLKGKGVMEITGRGDPTRGNYQFRHTQDGTTYIGSFYVNPNNSTVATKPHLNLETKTPGKPNTNVHTDIIKETVRPGDFPQ